MDRRSVLPVVRAAVGLLGLIALAVQISTSASAGTFDLLRFFAFFTVLSNLFAAFLLLALATLWRDVHSRRVDLLRGAAVVYLVVTFFVVILFLSGEDLQVAVPWVDFVVHKLVPVYLVADWMISPPSTRLTGRQSLVWLVFPLAWLVVTVLRGAIDGLVPVPVPRPGERRIRQRRGVRRRDLRRVPARGRGHPVARERDARAAWRCSVGDMNGGRPIERRIQTPDGRVLAVAEWGDPAGDPVIDMHGTPGGRFNRWRDVSIYARMGLRMFTFDRAGYGSSTRRPGRTVVDVVGDVEAIADDLGLERFVVAGASGGGPHALACAALLPSGSSAAARSPRSRRSTPTAWTGSPA